MNRPTELYMLSESIPWNQFLGSLKGLQIRAQTATFYRWEPITLGSEIKVSFKKTERGWNALLNGQCHKIFDFRLSTWLGFPQSPDCTIMAVSKFFENSWRYSQLKVHHRCRRQNLPLVLSIPVANFPLVLCCGAPCRCRWYWWCTLTWEYLREFSKKFETVLKGYSGPGGKLIHYKKTEAKNLVTMLTVAPNIYELSLVWISKEHYYS